MAAVVTSRTQRATWLLAVGVLATVAASVLAVRTAAADPVGDLQQQAQAIAQQLDALQHQAEVASERANGADYQLSQLDLQVSAARARAGQTNAAVLLNSAVLSQWAVRAYVGQDGSSGLGALFTGTSGESAMRGGYEQAVMGDRQQLLDDLSASQADDADATKALQAAESAAKAASDQARAERSQLLHLVAEQQQLQASVQGQLAQAVAQQQAALQAHAEQQAAAVAGPPAPGPSPAPITARSPDAPVAPGTTAGPRPAAPPTTSPAPHAPPPPAPGPAPPVVGGASTAVAAAMSQVGKPYVWGGGSPSTGFDCSGLTSWAWAQAGVSLPHYAQAQYDLTRHISASALQPGDLVFYADSTGYVFHVAMYIGGGQVVQALNQKYGVMVGSLYSAGSAPYGYGRV